MELKAPESEANKSPVGIIKVEEHDPLC